MEKRDGSVRSVEKAMELLDCLAAARWPLSLQELASQAGYPKSTTHALLSALRKKNIVHQSMSDGRYSLGVRLFELGSTLANSWDVRTAAKPHLQNLVLETRESADLAMLDGNEVLLASHFDAIDSLYVVTQVGSHLPLYCTALGKAVLAFVPERERRQLLGSLEFRDYTPHTILLDNIERELEAVRTNGFATENGEYRVGLRAVAAPIFDADGKVRYSIGVTGMFRRVESEDFQRAQKLVKAAAAKISNECGFYGS